MASILYLGLFLLLGAADSAELKYPPKYLIDSKIEGPESRYTGALLRLLKSWPPTGGIPMSAAEGVNPVVLLAYSTEGSGFYIGLEQLMKVNAPLEEVGAVLDDFNHYQDLFPGYDEVRTVSKDGNRVLTFWEQHIPLFFVPNIKYQITYLVDHSNPNRWVYRYQVNESKALKFNDGMIVIERQGDKTLYREYDFFEPDLGLAKIVGSDKIWRESVEGIYLSDVAIRLKAEHAADPQWTYERIRDESKKSLKRFPVDEVLKNRGQRKFNPGP